MSLDGAAALFASPLTMVPSGMVAGRPGMRGIVLYTSSRAKA